MYIALIYNKGHNYAAEPMLDNEGEIRTFKTEEDFFKEIPPEELSIIDQLGYELREVNGEVAQCQWCGDVTEFTDEGGRCETDLGWLCNRCIAALKSRGEELHFEDEDID